MRETWRGLAWPWRECFVLAWEAFQAGSVPVGAVLVDGAGKVVAAGRNRRSERNATAGQISGSNLAHAEMNALATLPPGDYPDHVLYTTLEPCLLCTAALRHSHVGTVRFAARDPLWSCLDRLPEVSQHIARHWARREDSVTGPMQLWAAVLPLVTAVERKAQSVVQCHAEVAPAALRLAQQLADSTTADLRCMELDDALDTCWNDLRRAATDVAPQGAAPSFSFPVE